MPDHPLAHFLHVPGVQLDIDGSNAVLYTSFDRIYSAGFCGSKAIDLCCALNGSPAASSAICIAARSRELGLALRSYDQVYRRLLKYAYQKRQASKGSGPLEIAIFVEEAGQGGEDATTAEYSDTITAFLQDMWKADYENVMTSAVPLST